MARLASVEKAGFYPTPARVVDMIASMVHPGIGAVILDPCCGEGDALAALGKAWGATTIGNELSKERAAKAAEKCDVITHGPIEFLQVWGYDDGGYANAGGEHPSTGERIPGCVSALFLNPPYDVGESGQRLELEFLEMATPWLTREGGWLFFIVPDYVLEGDSNPIVDYLAKHYGRLSVWRFPDGEYEAFKQVVITGYKKGLPKNYYYRERLDFANEVGLPSLLKAARSHWINLPAVPAPELTVRLPDAAETLSLATTHGPMTTSAWENVTSLRGLIGNFQPVNKPLPGHAAMLVIDGKVDGTEVEPEEGRLLLKGTHIKVIKTEETSEHDGGKTRYRKSEKERIVSVIHALNLDTGELKNYNSQAAKQFEEFLLKHQDKLIGAVDTLYPPLFVPNRDMPKWFEKLRRIHGPRPLPGSALNGLLPKQAECAVALAMLLERQKAGLLIGECGVGKTCLSLALQGLSNGGNFKVVVMAPAQVCAKWARESEAVLQEFGLKSHIIGKKQKQRHSVPVREGWAWTNGGFSNYLDKAKLGTDWHRTSWRQRNWPNAARFRSTATTRAVDGQWVGDWYQETRPEWGGTIKSRFWEPGHFTDVRWDCGPLEFKAKQAMVAKPILDITKAMEEPNPSLLVMSYETAKNGPPWKPAFNVKKRRVTWTETKSRSLSYYPYTEEYEETLSQLMDVACCPDCGVILQEDDGAPWPSDKTHEWWKKQQRYCPECSKPDAKTPLFQSLPFKYGGRFAAATFLNRKYAGKFSLIIDEAHNAKGRDTDVGQASMKLITAAKRVIGMTGTIYDGKASGVFAILYRMLPEFRQLYDFTQVQKFIEHHGLQETITTKTQKAGSRSTGSWGYGRENVRTKEMPGVTPGIISWILRMSVFIRKEHVSSSLPAYDEYRVPVVPSEAQQQTISDLNRAHGTAASKCRKGKMGLMSQWLYAACGALDYGEDDVIADDEDSFSIAGCTKPGVLLPKDWAVLDIVKREVAADRGVGIYFSQVNRRDWIPRLKGLLEAEGIHCVVLRANTCKKADREQWFQGTVKWFQSKKQPVVMLANGNLVKEGLDLVECPTLIETGIDFRLINVLQRDQRAHRITQEKDCKVYFVYYEGTFQETALSLVASKARAARKVDGKLIDGLAQMGAEEDLMSALIKAAQSEEQPMVVDWGDLTVEDIRPTLKEAAGPHQTLTVDVLDVLESGNEPVCDIGVLPKEECPICKHARDGEFCNLLPWNDKGYETALQKYIAWQGKPCPYSESAGPSTRKAVTPLPADGLQQLALF